MLLPEGRKYQNSRAREPQFWVWSAKPCRAARPMPAAPGQASFQPVRRLPRPLDLRAAPALFRDPMARTPKIQFPSPCRIPEAPFRADTDVTRLARLLA